MAFNKTYYVKTALSPEEIGEAAMETYRMWVEFAVGRRALGGPGGRLLRHPTGDYASAIQWKVGMRTAEIWTEEGPKEHPSVRPIEYGRPETELKPYMLGGGKNTRMDSEGHLYRIIPLKNDESTEQLVPGMSGSAMKMLSVETKERRFGNVRFRTMSDRPGSAPWIIPAMKPYAPAEILARMLEQQFGKRT